jgi:AcrR family transcriptional regulator
MGGDMVIKRRAISNEQKQVRRQAILDAALQLFQETSYEAVNIADVAKQADIAKGTVYLYFKTKEELFLALQTQAFGTWFEKIDTDLRAVQAAQGTCTVDEFVALMGRSLEDRSVLIRLIGILHPVLEHNIDFSAALSFKQMLRSRLLQTGSLLETCLPFLKPGEGVRLLSSVYALVIGVQHLAEPAPIVRQVIEEAGLEIFQIEFNDHFLETVRTLLYGMEFQSRKETNKQ